MSLGVARVGVARTTEEVIAARAREMNFMMIEVGFGVVGLFECERGYRVVR